MGYANKGKILILLIQDYYHLNESIWTIPKDWLSFQSTNKTAVIIVTRKDIEIIETYKDGNSAFANLIPQRVRRRSDRLTLHPGVTLGRT